MCRFGVMGLECMGNATLLPAAPNRNQSGTTVEKLDIQGKKIYYSLDEGKNADNDNGDYWKMP